MVTVRAIGLTGARFRDGKPSRYRPSLAQSVAPATEFTCVRIHSLACTCRTHFATLIIMLLVWVLRYICVIRIVCLFVAGLCDADLSHFNFICMGSLLV
jgi:hypothetical protein